MPPKPIIAVDIDDVLAANAAGFVAWSNETFDTHLIVEDYHEHWAEIWNVDEQETLRRKRLFHTSSHLAAYAPLSDARAVLEHLKKRFELILLTSRPLATEKTTREWIEKEYPNLFTDCVFCGFYDTAHTSGLELTKGALARELKAEYLIDDHLKHIESAAEAGITGLLFGEYSWNKKENLPPSVTRVKNWNEVLSYFDSKYKIF